MKKKVNDGIIFDNTVCLSEEGYKKFPVYMRLLQALAIFIGSYCFMSVFIRCFNLQIINDNNLISAIILSGGVIYLLSIYPAYDFIKIIVFLILYGLGIYYRYEQLKNGFFILENAVIRQASTYYGFAEFRFLADYNTAGADSTLLLIMVSIPVVAMLTVALVRGRFKLLCYIVLLLPAVVSFAMGVTPPEADLVAIILIALFLSISNSNTLGSAYKSIIYRISIRAAAMFCLLTLLLIFVIKQFVPVERYKAYDGIQAAKTKIQNFMMDFSIEEVTNKLTDIKLNIRTSRIKSTGGLSLGELGRVDQVTYDETEHLQITVPLKSVIEGIYLRGYIGSMYTGDSWKPHSRQVIENYEKMTARISQEEFEPAIGNTIFLNQAAYRLFINKGRIDITYLKANKNYIYAPYFTTFQDKDEIEFEYDLAAKSDTGMSIGTFDYRYNVFGSDSTDTNFTAMLELIKDTQPEGLPLDDEKEYRKFVYETYTMLPEEGLERLKNDFSREQVGKASENLKDAILYVKDYLNRFMRYTLAPGRTPKDKDFVEYFLYENKIGYCTHFASAGALMLRAMGYPARYVEGYAVNRSDILDSEYLYMGETEGTGNAIGITVKDYNAHAWVEVYYDGFGWIPIEFTTGAGMADMTYAIEDTVRDIQEPAGEPTAAPTDIPPSPTAVPGEDAQPSVPAPEGSENVKISVIVKEDAKSKSGSWWYLGIAVVFVFLGLYIFLRRIRKNNEKMSDNKRALMLYKNIEQLFVFSQELPPKAKSLEENEAYVKENLTFVPVKDFARCMDIIRKARFAKEPIRPMEYMVVEKFYNNLWNKTYNRLSRMKKAYMMVKIRLIFGKNMTN